MDKHLILNILKFGMYDTRKYRYTTRQASPYRLEIIRIALDKLGTTEALTGWKTVKVLVK